MKVLHIANWYPNRWEDREALFVKEHIKALDHFCQNDLVHLEVRYSADTFFKFVNYRISPTEEAFIILTSIKVWRVIEILYLKLLLVVLWKYKVNEGYDIINFHIAYPLLTYRDIIKKVIKLPFVVTEHWTAYHYNFNLPLASTKLDRIKKIFSSDLPLITVSQALCEDIKAFAKNENLCCKVVPNVVDERLFRYKEKNTSRISFFMLNYWREIKKPFVLLEAFGKVLNAYPDAHLRVGGYGPLWDEMISYVEVHGLEQNVEFLGKLSKEEVAKEMQGCLIFLHAADYETFSVVCAEALMCGTPVIMTKLPAVVEFINLDNGRLIDVEESWAEAIIEEVKGYGKFDNKEIAVNAANKFSVQSIGELYFTYLKKICNEA